MSLKRETATVTSFASLYWYLPVFGLALIGGSFIFARQSLIIYSRAFFTDTMIYVILQVAGWVILIEWFRLAGYLTLTGGD